jgi:glycosyltransferase involved in cell wall biosynthesis
MKILFVCSGNSHSGISPIVKNQGESLRKNGVELDYFTIKGKGFKGYFKNILPLRKYLKNNKFDIIHAHYALCGWVAVLANKFKKPVITSYMGSDTYGDYDENGKLIFSSYIQIFLAKTLQLFINTIIVKSKNLERYIYMKKKVNIIPNGVDHRIFEIIEKNEARNYLKLDLNKKYILFLGDKENKRKNYQLLQKANIISKNNFEIINPYPTKQILLVKIILK